MKNEKAESWYARFWAEKSYSAKEAYAEPASYGEGESEYQRWAAQIERELSDGWADDSIAATQHLNGLRILSTPGAPRAAL